MAEIQLRRTLLYVPGNMPSMLQNVPLFTCDAVQVDLEDAVPLNEKDAARFMIRSFLDMYPPEKRDKEVLVRINALDTKWAEDDLKMVLPGMPDGIRLPMTTKPEIVQQLDEILTKFEKDNGIKPGHFVILPSIETADGVINSETISYASPRLIGLAFGAEDYTASMGIERTRGGEELASARLRIVMAAKAAGIQAIDSVFSDVNDMEALRAETELIKRLGFTGKSLVNPRQIDIIHDVFAPRQEQVDYALEVVDAIKRARELGTGVISLRGKMIDAPVVKRAVLVLHTAYAQGLVNEPINEEEIYGTE